MKYECQFAAKSALGGASEEEFLGCPVRGPLTWKQSAAYFEYIEVNLLAPFGPQIALAQMDRVGVHGFDRAPSLRAGCLGKAAER
jgi:hypothetical protein